MQMSDAAKIRAEIDSATNKALLYINGGASVALLAFMPAIITDIAYRPLAKAVVVALGVYQVALFAAVRSNTLRRECSMVYEGAWIAGRQPAPCSRWGHTFSGPCVCVRERTWRGISLALFMLGGLTIVVGGWLVVWNLPT